MKPDSLKDLDEKGRLREDAKSMAKLTREQLLELEEREKTPKEKFFDVVFMLMPVVFALISLAEYTMLPDLNPNPMPYLYTGLLAIMLAAYVIAAIVGATERQLIFRVAIPHAMPNIMAGMTQGMSTACTAIMVAEMMGVKAGLGWYITWVKSWALYNNMFASLIVICAIFTIVTKVLAAIKKRVLRWQIGVTK